MKCILIYEIKVCLINNINIKTGLKKYKHDFRFLNNYWLTLQFCNWVDHILTNTKLYQYDKLHLNLHVFVQHTPILNLLVQK